MEYPISELIDRFIISRIKASRILSEEALAESYVYETELTRNKYTKFFRDEMNLLQVIHDRIWQLESDIRQGKEKTLGLEEVGRRALRIRDLNAQRIEIKNRIAEKAGDRFREQKFDHASDNVNQQREVPSCR